jgi:hypothetical protein
MRIILALLALTAAVAAAPVSAEPDATWTRHRTDTFSLELPRSWADASKDRAKLLAEVRKLYDGDAKAAAMIDGLLAAGNGSTGVRMIAFDLAPTSLATGFATNLNVLLEPTLLPFAAWRRAAEKSLASMSFVRQPIWSDTVKLRAGKAVRFRYRARFTISGRRLDTSITQYAVLKGGTAYVLTYTTLPKLAAGYRATFDRSARSFRLG